MKLNPVDTSDSPRYPERRTHRATLGARIRRAAVAVGASTILGLAACGGADSHSETANDADDQTAVDRDDEILPPGIPAVPHDEHPAPEPAPVEEAQDESDAQLDNRPDPDPMDVAGGLRPPRPPEPVITPPPAPDPAPLIIVTPPPVVVTTPPGNDTRPPQVVKPPPEPYRTAGLIPAPDLQ